jgi:hypothetical protein
MENATVTFCRPSGAVSEKLSYIWDLRGRRAVRLIDQVDAGQGEVSQWIFSGHEAFDAAMGPDIITSG